MSCGICGEDGHNRRTHDQHPEPQEGALLEALATGEVGVSLASYGAALLAREASASVELDRDQTHDVGPVCTCPGPVELPPGQHREGCRFRVVYPVVSATPDENPQPHDVALLTPELVAGTTHELCHHEVCAHMAERDCDADCSTADEIVETLYGDGPLEDRHPPLTEYGNDLINPGQQHAERTADVANQIASAFQVPGELLGPDVDPWPIPPWRTVLGPDEPIRITLPGVWDLTAEQYHDVNITGDWFSNSDGKALLRTCPEQFDYDRRHNVRKTSDAFDFGHVWHAVILGKGEQYQVFEPKKLDGRTAAGKAQKVEVDAARAAGITPVYGDQFALILAMAEAVKANPVAHQLMTAPGRQEVCLFWREDIKITDPHNKLFGQVVTVQRRAMIDQLPDIPEGADTVTLIDGKTADEVKPDDNLRKRIYDYAYHRQADGYAAGVEALFNVAAEVVFLFQSKRPPHLIVPVDLDTPAQRVAAAENRQALELWAECVATGEWPGYTKGIATSGVPAWIERQFDEEIGEF